MKSLADLITAADHLTLHGDPAVPLSGLACDSRQVQPGFLFAALPGTKADGAAFIPDALARGAAALLVQAGVRPAAAVPVVESPDPRLDLARFLAAYYDRPSARLELVGVTGTKGKTTTTYLLEAVLGAGGRRTGVIGTIGYKIAGEVQPATHTTPDACVLQQLFARMVERGVTHAAMELSSHALDQHRADFTEFRAAVFTNLSRDHMDYHPTVDHYFAAKARLFQAPELQPATRPRLNVVNVDDEYGRRLLPLCRGEVVTYGLAPDAAYRAADLALAADSTTFTLHAPQGVVPVTLRLVGRFNVYNALAAAAVGLGLGLPLEPVVGALSALPPVRGRFERLDWPCGPSVVIDYAHTPDSLEQALQNARRLTSGRLIVAFGCGGDRDTGKRPMMGEIGARLADLCVVTSDNPRTESPAAILDQIVAGIPADRRSICRVEPDRQTALEAAVAAGQAGDLVLIAGKGHETYQIFADRTIHFDDAEVARAALAHFHPCPGANRAAADC